MKDRAQLRGKPLDEDCKTARTTTHESESKRSALEEKNE